MAGQSIQHVVARRARSRGITGFSAFFVLLAVIGTGGCDGPPSSDDQKVPREDAFVQAAQDVLGKLEQWMQGRSGTEIQPLRQELDALAVRALDAASRQSPEEVGSCDYYAASQDLAMLAGYLDELGRCENCAEQEIRATLLELGTVMRRAEARLKRCRRARRDRTQRMASERPVG